MSYIYSVESNVKQVEGFVTLYYVLVMVSR